MENIEEENFKEVAAATIPEEGSETIVKKENVEMEETLKAEEDSLNCVKTEESVNIVKNEDTEIVDDKMCNTKREEFNISETKLVHEDDRKIFVGALPQEANAICIREYFGSFGEVESINLKLDPVTGRSRGFAFVVFKELAGLEAALVQTDHAVMGKKVTCKKAEARRQGKIYVGKLPPGHSLSKEDLRAHFEHFGPVVEVNLTNAFLFSNMYLEPVDGTEKLVQVRLLSHWSRQSTWL